jgi:hypothetical protein
MSGDSAGNIIREAVPPPSRERGFEWSSLALQIRVLAEYTVVFEVVGVQSMLLFSSTRASPNDLDAVAEVHFLISFSHPSQVFRSRYRIRSFSGNRRTLGCIWLTSS